MPPESRRAAREAAEAAARETRPATVEERKPSRARAVWLTIGIIAVVLLAAVAWVGIKALTVKSELEAAERLVSGVTAGTSEDLPTAIAQIGGHAQTAADAAGDPVWRALEFIPAVGDNLRGVRLSAEALDALANDLGTPVLGAAEGEGVLAAMLAVVVDKGPEIARISDEVAAVQASPFLVGPVRNAVDKVGEVTAVAGPAMRLMPTLLGAEGGRNYLLVFQNNAELLAMGGSAASQSLVSVDAGNISIANQASSASFQNGTGVPVEVDQSAKDIFGRYLTDYVNTSMMRPDFPTAARLVTAWWQRDIAPDQIDGVISVDPIALSRILVATGPIPLAGGDTLSSDNALSLLLSEVYTRSDSYRDPDVADAFFADAAGAVFNAVASGDFNLKDMLWAVSTSADRGNIFVWSEDEQIAAAIDGQPVSGVLPSDNSDQTAVGVFFQNTSASKIDYYSRAAIAVDSVCNAEGATFTARTDFTLDISQAAADALPRYVKSFHWGSTQFRTNVFVYGPPGTTFTSAEVEGREVTPTRTDLSDLGRPVAEFEMFLRPGETASVTASFTGTGDFGPLTVRTTPVIGSEQPVVTDGCAG